MGPGHTTWVNMKWIQAEEGIWLLLPSYIPLPSLGPSQCPSVCWLSASSCYNYSLKPEKSKYSHARQL